MDSDGNIYRAPKDKIPAEDSARLDGYLRARAERYSLKSLAECVKELKSMKELLDSAVFD